MLPTAFGRDRFSHTLETCAKALLQVDGLTFGCQTHSSKNISSSHRKPRYSHTLVPSRHCKLRRMNLIAFYVCENKQLNIFQFCRKDLPPHEASGVKMCVLSCAPATGENCLDFHANRRNAFSAHTFGGILDFSRPRRLEGFGGFSHFFSHCYSNQPHNVNSQLPRTVYAVCVHVLNEREKTKVNLHSL